MDKLVNKAPNDLTDYRIVKLLDGSTLVGSISLDKEFLRAMSFDTTAFATSFVKTS